MRILINGAHGPSLANFRGPLIKAMIARGAEVLCVAPDDNGRTAAEVEALGASYIPSHLQRASIGIRSDLAYLSELCGIIRKQKPDIMLSYSIKASIYGSIAARIARVPRVFSLISGLGYTFTNEKGIRKAILRMTVGILMRIAFWCCRGVFFQNDDDVNDLRRMNILGRRVQVHVVAGSGIDRNHFPEQALPEYQDGSIVFLLIARLIRDKGIVEFVEALRSLKPRYNVKGILVAPPDANPKAISVEAARKWQDEGLIDYVAWAQDVRPYLRGCHVYVLPSYYREGTPRTILEALSTGRPVITTDSPGCRDTVQLTSRGLEQKSLGEAVLEGTNGFLVRAKDSVAVATAMENLLVDAALRADMRENALALAREKYDVNLVNKAMIDTMFAK